MEEQSSETVIQRKVGIRLALGVVLLPWIFVWFLLRDGHSSLARLFGFGWAGLLLLFSLSTVGIAPPDEQAPLGPTSREAPRQLASDASPDPIAPWPKDGDGVRVAKSGFETRSLVWPLTVDTAVIGCKRPDLLWVEADGTRYGLNGMGQIHLKLDRFDDIWASDSSFPSVPGGDKMRLSPSDLMAEARKLCE